MLGHELKGRLKFKVNRDKTVVLVGSKALAEKLKPRLKDLGVPFARLHKQLGVGLTAGAAGAHNQAGRVAAAASLSCILQG